MTSIDQIVERLLDNQTYANDDYVTIDLSVEHFNFLVQQAKRMHKDEIRKAFEDGRKVGTIGHNIVNGEYYYNENYESYDNCTDNI